MSVQMLGSILRRLENLFQFKSTGRSAPSEFETNLPIQPVMDVGPMAGLGRAIGENGGFWVSAVEITHVATGEISVGHSLRYSFPLNGYPPIPSYNAETEWAWVYNVWVNCSDNSDLQFARQALNYDDTVMGCHGGVLPSLGVQPLMAGDTVLFDIVENELENSPAFPLPVLLSPYADSVTDCFLVCVSKADNAGTLVNTFQNLFWVGPKGIHPPMVS